MKQPSPAPGPTSGRLLAKNTLWNLAGQGAPLLAALVTIPILVRSLGTERVGILSLIWMVIGYFSVFDLGLGRALTKVVAARLGTGRLSEIPTAVWSALYLTGALGVLGTIALLAGAPPFINHVLKVPAELRSETVAAFEVLALSIPLVVCTASLRGVLEANQRFDLVNAIRLPMGLTTFVGPLLVLPFSRSLVPVTGVLLAFRAAALIAHAWLCVRTMPVLRHRVPVRRQDMALMLGYGGWMTISNVVGPAMIYMDRLLIGSLVSMAAVAYYVTPYEMVTRLLIVPAAVSAVLFPAFSASLESRDDQSSRLFWQGVKYVFLPLFPVLFLATLYSSQILDLWLGPTFAREGSRALQWLCVGVFANSLAYVPFALIQSAGRPDATAKLHFLELPFYGIVLWVCLVEFGIVGAAFAWALRAAVDAGALFALASNLVPGMRGTLGRDAAVFAAAMAGFAAAASCPQGLPQATLAILVMLPFCAFGWTRMLTESERRFFLDAFRKRLPIQP